MTRVLLRPRWIVLHIIMLIFMPLFATAGLWQLRRLDEKRTKNALVTQRRELPPVTSLDGDDLEFRRAQLVGTYDRGANVILTGRPLNGRSGDHVLTPLLTEDGTVIVDRGWVEAGDENTTTPEGAVSVSGVLLPSEGRAPFTPSTGNTKRITRIDLARLGGGPVYLLLREQEPAQPGDLPAPAPLAALSEGSHLSYAVQWFLFIPTAIVVYVLVLRRAIRSAAHPRTVPA